MTAPAKPPGKIYKPITTLASLQEHLQWAMAVELSTIPPYLAALYSIQDNTTDAYRLIRSIALEEMLHMMLVANLMNATGKSPSLSGDTVPRYPGYIPHHAAGGPYIQLQPLSPTLCQVVFMAIEQPETSPKSPPEGNHFETIGQFYKAIADGFRYLVEKEGEKAVFDHPTSKYQTDAFYFGAGGGHPIVVKDLKSALRAIEEIVEQGEGATHPQPPVPGDEPFGGYEHYGKRLDGTYGPILGTPWELSHYNKFEAIANGKVASPAVYPMTTNPRPSDLEGPARRLAELFDAAYGLVLSSLQTALSSIDQKAFFGVGFPVMQTVLPRVAGLLVQTPLDPKADPTLGPNAGPAFLARHEPIAATLAEAKALLSPAVLLEIQKTYGTTYQQTWEQTLAPVVATLEAAKASS